MTTLQKSITPSPVSVFFLEVVSFSRSFSYFEMDLPLAANYGDLERVQLLVEQGADKDKGNDSGDTPLRLASRGGWFDVVRYLVEQGSSLEKAAIDGCTPLTGASACGHLEIVRYLLEKGAEMDKADNDGDTPLHCAAANGHLEIAKLLISQGADLNVRNNSGQLPIDRAANEAIKQAIRNESRHRIDYSHKRAATEHDRHADVTISASTQRNEDDKEDEEEQSNKRLRLDEGVAAIVEEDTKVEKDDKECLVAIVCRELP